MTILCGFKYRIIDELTCTKILDFFTKIDLFYNKHVAYP